MDDHQDNDDVRERDQGAWEPGVAGTQMTVKPGRSMPADLPTLKSLKPEHLFMLCEWNSVEGQSEARSLSEGGSGGPPMEKNANGAISYSGVICE